MRLHPDGYIETARLEVTLPKPVVWRALRVGDTLLLGVARELEGALGIRIEGAERVRVVSDDGQENELRIESSWVRPSRR